MNYNCSIIIIIIIIIIALLPPSLILGYPSLQSTLSSPIMSIDADSTRHCSARSSFLPAEFEFYKTQYSVLIFLSKYNINICTPEILWVDGKFMDRLYRVRLLCEAWWISISTSSNLTARLLWLPTTIKAKSQSHESSPSKSPILSSYYQSQSITYRFHPSIYL